jgi:hypothetical protein
MAIHDESTVVGVAPRISQQRFTQILRDFPSPAAAEAEAGWNAVAEEGVDPLFALAVFHQESQFGTDGVCLNYATRSPGNTRSSLIGVGEIVATEFGNFVRYPRWTDGWRDLGRRLSDPDYVYQREGRRAIRQIIYRWAPPEDFGNDTEAYIARVASNMNAWQDVVCQPESPPSYDGADKQVNETVFHAARQTVEVATDGLACRQWADPSSCETRSALRRGDSFQALYWVEGVEIEGERRWWVAESGSRIWSGGTVQRPGSG